MIISIGAAFDKIQYCEKNHNGMIKFSANQEYLKNTIANFNSEILNIFPLRSGTRHTCSLSHFYSAVFNTS